MNKANNQRKLSRCEQLKKDVRNALEKDLCAEKCSAATLDGGMTITGHTPANVGCDSMDLWDSVDVTTSGQLMPQADENENMIGGHRDVSASADISYDYETGKFTVEINRPPTIHKQHPYG